MQSPSSPSSGSRGGRTTVSTKDRGVIYEDQKSTPVVPETPASGPMASVGLSVSVGQSTEFARQKIEVAAWCTLPCLPDEVSVRDAYQACYDIVTEEISARSNQAIQRFFPEMAGG